MVALMYLLDIETWIIATKHLCELEWNLRLELQVQKP